MEGYIGCCFYLMLVHDLYDIKFVLICTFVCNCQITDISAMVTSEMANISKMASRSISALHIN